MSVPASRKSAHAFSAQGTFDAMNVHDVIALARREGSLWGEDLHYLRLEERRSAAFIVLALEAFADRLIDETRRLMHDPATQSMLGELRMQTSGQAVSNETLAAISAGIARVEAHTAHGGWHRFYPRRDPWRTAVAAHGAASNPAPISSTGQGDPDLN